MAISGEVARAATSSASTATRSAVAFASSSRRLATSCAIEAARASSRAMSSAITVHLGTHLRPATGAGGRGEMQIQTSFSISEIFEKEGPPRRVPASTLREGTRCHFVGVPEVHRCRVRGDRPLTSRRFKAARVRRSVMLVGELLCGPVRLPLMKMKVEDPATYARRVRAAFSRSARDPAAIDP